MEENNQPKKVNNVLYVLVYIVIALLIAYSVYPLTLLHNINEELPMYGAVLIIIASNQLVKGIASKDLVLTLSGLGTTISTYISTALGILTLWLVVNNLGVNSILGWIITIIVVLLALVLLIGITSTIIEKFTKKK